MRWNILMQTICLLATFWATTVSSIAVMSVDLGSEWMKVGIVSPGVPMEIALNKESKRKTPAVITYKDDTRTFGEDAQTIGIRFPKASYGYLLDLLGKDINNPMVKLYQARFPYYEIVEDPQRGTVLFKHSDSVVYSPEELVAQLLIKAKEFAEQSAQQPISACVLTVPGYFNQAERNAMLQAASLANLKVLQLINDYTAVALNYGIFRSKDFNETAQYIMFYDMGASKTTATLVSYQVVKTKERGFVETHPQLSIVGVGYDRTLGGLEMQLRLRDHLARKFNEMKKTKNDVFNNPRALAKLFKEAGRVKNVLSANADHYAQVEGLLDEIDFKVQVTREELEHMCSDLFDRVGTPIERALKTAGLTMDVVRNVVLVGAGTRVPKVQELLQKYVQMELSKNLNTDEAATMGAVYKAADLSTGFKVKKFITKDAVIFPIQVLFDKAGDAGTKVRRTLFNLMNPYPQKKIITFNKHVNDFSFNVNYADLDYLPTDEVWRIGALNLTEVSLKGVGDALKKHMKEENVESKGIKAHFAMDESGLLSLTNVDLIFEKTVPAEAEEENTLSKLGSTISKLFSSKEEEKPVEEKPVTEPPAPSTNETKETETPKNATADAPKNGTDSGDAKATKPKMIVVKEPIESQEKILIVNPMTPDQIDESLKKITKLEEIDREQNRRATALNNLESFVIDAQGKIDSEEYSSAITEKDLQKVKKACDEVSEWLYEDGSDAEASVFEKKLKELKSLTNDWFSRVFEHRERPEALSALQSMINGSMAFLDNAKNLTKAVNPDKDVFTDVEIQTLQKVIDETIAWRDQAVEEQSKLKNYESVKLTVRSISEKMMGLDREVKYLVNKLKIWRPKIVEKPVREEPENSTSTEEGNAKEAKTESDEEVQVEEPNVVVSENSDEVEPTQTSNDSSDQHSEL